MATTDLKTIVEELRRQIAGDAGSSIGGLADIAATLEMANTTKDLYEIQEQLASDTFKLMAVGRFKNGKSTLVNALLGKLTDPVPDLKPDQGPMPVDDLPCTAIVTSVVYAKKPYVRVWGSDGRWQEWSFARYLRDAVAQDNQEATESKLKGIRYFEVGFPAELCAAGVTMMDSPGVDDVPERDEITRQAISGCDTALVVYRSDAFGGMNEMKFVSEDVLGESTRIFTVISMRNNRLADERFRGFVWNKLIHEGQDGPAYAGQDFTERDIYFVDSLKAFHAKVDGDTEALTASGLPILEQRLGKFLAEESQNVHLRKFLHKATLNAGAIESQIGQRRAGLQAESAELQEAYETIQPKIQAVRRRGNRLPKLFDRYNVAAQNALKASFSVMIEQLRKDLPAELAPRPLSVIGLNATFKQKQLCAEATAMCEEIVKTRLQMWSNTLPGKIEPQKSSAAASTGEETPRMIGAQETLTPIMAQLTAEIDKEVAEMDRDMRAAQVELTGWDVTIAAPTSVVGTNERIWAGIASFMIGDITGGFGGWRSMAGALTGHICGGLLLASFGLMGSVIFLPAVIIIGMMTGLVWGAEDIDKRAKAKVVEEVDKSLQQMPDQIAAVLEAEMNKVFASLQEQTITLVHASLDEEEANFRKIMEMNKQDQGQKQEMLTQLNALESHAAELRGKLAAAEERVKPGAAAMPSAGTQTAEAAVTYAIG